MKKIDRALLFIKNNTRYLLAFLSLGLISAINMDFPAEIVSSASCEGGGCIISLQDPNLTDKTPAFHINDVFQSSSNGYFRLVFQTKSNKNTKIIVKANSPIDEEKELKRLDLKRTVYDSPQEIIFSTDRRYTDIFFEKEDRADGAEVSIAGIQVTKLDISNDQDLSSLKSTIFGNIDFGTLNQSQNDNSKYFTQLMEPQMIFGEIFKPQDDYISGVELDFDVIKQSNNGGRKYKLELRNVEYEEGGAPEIKSNALSQIDFSLDELEKYRQEDGKFKFPLYAKLDKNKYYFIGINNDRMDVNKFNYLRLRGTSDGEKFKNGSLAVKFKGQSYLVAGDLYFSIYGIKYGEYNGKKILRGSVMEDIGKKKGIFKYHLRGDTYDLIDLDSYSSDINFNEGKGALAGSTDSKKNTENRSYFIYKFETIFSFTKFRIFARQADINWNRVLMSYSYDSINWKEIPSNENDTSNSNDYGIRGVQFFDTEISENIPKDKIFIKISPQDLPEDGKKYGIKDFKFEADLKIE